MLKDIISSQSLYIIFSLVCTTLMLTQLLQRCKLQKLSVLLSALEHPSINSLEHKKNQARFFTFYRKTPNKNPKPSEITFDTTILDTALNYRKNTLYPVWTYFAGLKSPGLLGERSSSGINSKHPTMKGRVFALKHSQKYALHS